ncbi:uncharacterized protein LOC142330382 [Lycorma delicatula]|uniref:uncharacterized protein LOC142330382 n=1 Tax=Lycorma delicatula TaxID=130591 RepID=UPI003F513097
MELCKQYSTSSSSSMSSDIDDSDPDYQEDNEENGCTDMKEGDYNSHILMQKNMPLLNWEKLLKYRKKQHEYFKSVLKREPENLTMNSDYVYEKKQKAELIEHATKYKVFDKYRGDPKFWLVPDYIKDKQTKIPLICPVDDKFDRTIPNENKPPIMEYIGIPNLIKYEKGMNIEKKSEKITYHKCNYFDERKLELNYNVEKIETFKPDLSNLYIMEFPSCLLNELYLKKVLFENTGNIAIRYLWEKIKPYKNPELPLRYTVQLIKRFTFPNASNILLPGQITEILFMFKSREPGFYYESWKLITDPIISKNKSIIITLRGFVKATSNLDEIIKIESYIKRHEAKTCAELTVTEWLYNNKIEIPYEYRNLFMERDIFLHNNPDYFYVSEHIHALREMHDKITGNKQYDYSIRTLRDNILTNVEATDEKRKYLEKLYEISNMLLKPHVESNMNSEKYRCVYQILCTFCNSIEYNAEELRIIYQIENIPILKV